MRTTWRALGCRAAGAVAAATLLAVAAPATADGRPRTVHFTAPFTDRSSMVFGVYQCGIGQTGFCDFKFNGIGRFSGSLTTVVEYFGYGHGDPARARSEGESWDRHTGSLKGCGEGSFLMHQTEIIGHFDTFDPVTHTYRVTLKWVIVPGSGTGDFTGARGSGTGQGRADLQFANTGTYSGSVTCPRGSNRS